MSRSVITGTGAFIPERILENKDFEQNRFYDEKGRPLTDNTELIIEKFRKITGISERRYVPEGINTSDIAAEAGNQALINSGIDPETLDQIQSHAWFKAGMAKKVLLIGAETLSRVLDFSDRDSMIFGDGAGACVLEYKDSPDDGPGILGTCAQTHSQNEFDFIDMGRPYKGADNSSSYFMKMKGRKVYEYALKHVPSAMKLCLDQAGVDIRDISKILIHQANEKMDEEIVSRLYALYGIEQSPPGIMPMSIQWLGNSSVATIPTLYHLILKGQMPEHAFRPNDIIVFASVGAGMNINAVCYRV
jgi:3-oxoacyl-[acyl-carrier-protein] synthase-3